MPARPIAMHGQVVCSLAGRSPPVLVAERGDCERGRPPARDGRRNRRTSSRFTTASWATQASPRHARKPHTADDGFSGRGTARFSIASGDGSSRVCAVGDRAVADRRYADCLSVV